MSLLFYVLIVLLLLRPQDIFPSLAGIPILASLLALGLMSWTFAPRKHVDLPQFLLLLLLTLAVPLSVALSGWLGGAPHAFDEFAPQAALFVIASMAARRLEALRVAMWLTVLCGCTIVLHGHLQLAHGIGPLTGVLPREGRTYYVGIFNDPNDLGQLLVVAIGFCLYLVESGTARIGRLLLVLALAWLCYGVYLTDSRGAMLAIVGVLAIVAARRYGRVVMLITAALAVPALFAATRLSKLSASEESASMRVDAWYEGLQMLRSHPLRGVGYGNFADQNAGLTAHNILILPMAELGLVGYAIWFAFVLYTVRMLWWVAHGSHARPTNDRKAPTHGNSAVMDEIAAARGLEVACVGYAISAFFLSQSFKALLYLLAGMVVARFISSSTLLPQAPRYQLIRDLPKLLVIALVSVVGMYVLVVILL